MVFWRGLILALCLMAGSASAASAQRPDEMGPSCDWLSTKGIKWTPGDVKTAPVRIGIDFDGSLLWNEELLDRGFSDFEKKLADRLKPTSLPQVSVEPHPLAKRASIERVMRKLNEGGVTPVCAPFRPPVLVIGPDGVPRKPN